MEQEHQQWLVPSIMTPYQFRDAHSSIFDGGEFHMLAWDHPKRVAHRAAMRALAEEFGAPNGWKTYLEVPPEAYERVLASAALIWG